MIETNSLTQKNSVAILLQEPPRLWGVLHMIGVCLLGLAFALSVAWSAAGQAKPATDTKTTKTQNASDFVGSETCATCHTDEAKNFDGNPHAKLALEHGKSGASCEGCHGAGREHVEGGGDKTKIFSFKTASPKQASERCLSCHEGTHPNFLRSPHAKAAVSCTSCHSVHAPSEELGAKDHLLKVAEPKLCFGCHSDVKPSFSMPFHHKVNEGAVKCADCHDVHGTFGNNNLRSAADQSAICTKCHTETRGPFVYEHAAVKAEGCMGCHTPHGSQNARLLNMPNVNTLCNQCHSPVAAATVHGMNAGSSELTPCISCHTMIHGSNLNQAFLK